MSIDPEQLLQRMKAVYDAGNSKVVDEVKGLGAEIKSLSGRVSNVEDTVKDLKTKHIALADEVKKMQEQGANSNTGAKGSEQEVSWLPSYAEIKGFCTFDNKQSEGVDRKEALELMEKLKPTLPEHVRGSVGEIVLRGARSYSIKIPLLVPEHALEIRASIAETLRKNPTRGDKYLFISLEPTPSRKHEHSLFGKLKVFIENKCPIDYSAEALWAPDFVIFAEMDGCQPVLVAELAGVTGVKWYTEGLELLKMSDEEEANKLLKCYRRRP